MTKGHGRSEQSQRRKEREGGSGTPRGARPGPRGAALAGAAGGLPGWSSEGSTRLGCCILRARWVQFTGKSLGNAISQFFFFLFFLFFPLLPKSSSTEGVKAAGTEHTSRTAIFHLPTF